MCKALERIQGTLLNSFVPTHVPDEVFIPRIDVVNPSVNCSLKFILHGEEKAGVSRVEGVPVHSAGGW